MKMLQVKPELKQTIKQHFFKYPEQFILYLQKFSTCENDDEKLLKK